MDNTDSPQPDLAIQHARALLISASVLWGLSFPLLRGIELAQQQSAPTVPALALASADMAVRFGLAALFLLPLYGRQLLQVTGREWSQAAGLALLAGIGLYLQTLGLVLADASVAAFLTQLYTLIVPLIVAVRDRSFPSVRVIVACVMVLLGAAMLSPGLLTHFTPGGGELVIIISTIFFASQIVWVERPVYVGNRSGLVTLIMFAFLAGMFAVGYPVTGGTIQLAGQMFGTAPLWELMLAMVLLCTCINFFIMNTWQRRLSATEAGLIYCIEPVVATLLASFLPGWISRFAGVNYPDETLTWMLLLGGLLILGATILVATEGHPHAAQPVVPTKKA